VISFKQEHGWIAKLTDNDDKSLKEIPYVFWQLRNQGMSIDTASQYHLTPCLYLTNEV
jgi:GH25 family lysozyme M1 (1,4-beta-N-acetylmuramidase)